MGPLAGRPAGRLAGCPAGRLRRTCAQRLAVCGCVLLLVIVLLKGSCHFGVVWLRVGVCLCVSAAEAFLSLWRCVVACGYVLVFVYLRPLVTVALFGCV